MHSSLFTDTNSVMMTLNIAEAAELLKIHVATLYKLAEKGQVPAAKIGKRLVFIYVDLIDHIRSKYRMQASISDPTERSNTCHFLNAKTQAIGGSKLLPSTESEYKKALGLK